MIRILQRKFILASMTAISVLILVLAGAINLVNIVITDHQMNETLRRISDSRETPESLPKIPEEGTHPLRLAPPDERDVFMNADYFIVGFDRNGDVVFSDISRILTVDEESASEIAEQILDTGKSEGTLGQYRYVVQENHNGTDVICLDTTGDIYSCIRVLLVSAGLGLLCWIVMLLFVILLSRKAIHPIAENMERQKQFVTNAGHEIKTPLAIIQSNTEAMELYQGENKWSRNIKEQTARLNELIRHLLMLARMDENTVEIPLEDLSLSTLAEETAERFEEAFRMKEISVRKEIQTSVMIKANGEYVDQMLSVLLDNALKYTNKKGSVLIQLEKNERRVKLEISNTCEQLPVVPPEQLFERFYRGDEARTQKTGGYGIGLSVAKAIAEACRGTLTAEYRNNAVISFTVRFRNVERKSSVGTRFGKKSRK